MGIFLIISLLILINYCGIIAVFIHYFNKKNNCKTTNEKEIDLILLVVFKNEEENILNFLQSIHNLQYPIQKYKVLLANDYSTDSSVEIAENFIKLNKIENIELIHLNKDSRISPKFFAFKSLIDKLTTEYIVLLDADCELKKGFLNTISNKISNFKPALILNPLIIKTNRSFFSKLQAIEFSSLMASTISSSKMEKPIMANGASMVVETKFLKQYIKEYDSQTIMHGDDMYMLDFASQLKKKIIFNDDYEAISSTSPKKNLICFIKQRIRWASKSALYKSAFINYVAISVLLISIILFSLIMLTLFNLLFLKYLFIIFALKFLFDGILIYKILHFEQRKCLFLYSFFMIFFYPIYVVIIFVFSLFRKQNIQWK